jgi:DNA polymerase theta
MIPDRGEIAGPPSNFDEFWGNYCQVKKIASLFNWQSECLGQRGVLDHSRNLVYSAPTSGGKSLVADHLLAKRLLAGDCDIALMVLPFVSLCRERLVELAELFEPVGVQVRGFFGGRPGFLPPKFGRGGLIIATPERANEICNKLIADGRMSELVTVVVDELHLVQDKNRGSVLERMLTKLMHAAAAVTPREPPGLPMQVIAMSATLPRDRGLDALARWLGDAALYVTDHRPVKLDVKVVCLDVPKSPPVTMYRVQRDDVFDEGPPAPPRSAPARPPGPQKTRDALADVPTSAPAPKRVDTMSWTVKWLVGQAGDGGVMIFCCPGRKEGCENLAVTLSASGKNTEDTEALAANLPPGKLADCVAKGVAWHHADLPPDEKIIVERGFRENIIRVVCCTQTMATGVNLPASRVIVYPGRAGGKGFSLLSSRDLQQMVGRAGRTGLSNRAEAFVITPRPNEVRDDGLWNPLAIGEELGRRILSGGEQLDSNIAGEGMRPVMLEGVACGLVRTPDDARIYCNRTLLAALDGGAEKDAADALGWLEKYGFLEWKDDAWEATDIGRAASAAHLKPETIGTVVEDIKRARRRLILDSDLHLLYLCINLHDADHFNAKEFMDIYSHLGAREMSVADAAGIEESYVEGRLRRHKMDVTQRHVEQRRACHRLLHALKLADLISEIPVEVPTAVKDRAEMYAGQVAAVCGGMGWGDMEGLLIRLRDRINAGTKEEIMALMAIPQIGASRARKLFNRGLKTPAEIAKKTREDLCAILGGTPAWVVGAILDGAKKHYHEQRETEREESEAKLRELGTDPGVVTTDLGVFRRRNDDNFLPEAGDAPGKVDDVEAFSEIHPIHHLARRNVSLVRRAKPDAKLYQIGFPEKDSPPRKRKKSIDVYKGWKPEKTANLAIKMY